MGRLYCAAMTGAIARALACAVAVMAGTGAGAAAEPAPPMRLETHVDPFDYTSAVRPVEHVPLTRAARRHRLCVTVPHMKDEYWLSVNYGMAREAQRLGVALRVVEAGGYLGATAQAEQLRACVRGGADAVVIGAVSASATELLAAVAEVSRSVPVVAAVNELASADLAAKVGVSWRDMGRTVGAFLAARHPSGTTAVRAVLVSGPAESGWAPILEDGLRTALEDSSVQLVGVRGADTGHTAQLHQVENVLRDHPQVDYIVGSAPAAEAAMSLLRLSGRTGEVRVLSTYFTHAVRRGVLRGGILAAPNDNAVLQGRLAIEFAVRAVEGKLRVRQIGPPVELVEPDNVAATRATLAPSDFAPVFARE